MVVVVMWVNLEMVYEKVRERGCGVGGRDVGGVFSRVGILGIGGE